MTESSEPAARGAASEPPLPCCTRCRVSSPIVAAFERVSALLWWRDRVLCPPCRRVVRQLPMALAAVLVWTVLWGVAFIAVWPIESFAVRVLVVTALVPALLVAIVVAHECVHALVGLAVGASVLGIRVGGHRPVRSWRVRGANITLGRPFLSGGLCFLAFTDARTSRVRIALAVGAPLLVHAGVLALLWPWLSFNATAGWARPGVLDLVWLLNLLIFVVNVHPRTIGVGPGGHPTDGKRLLALLRDPDLPRQLRLGGVMMRVEHHLAADDGDRARDFLAAHLDAFSADGDAQLVLAWCRARVGDHDEALRIARALMGDAQPVLTDADLTREELRLALVGAAPPAVGRLMLLTHLFAERGQLDEVVRLCESQIVDGEPQAITAIWRNNLAYYLLRHRPDDGTARAVELTRLAIACLPWVGYVRGTRGIALIETGSVDEGLDLLDRADAADRNPASVSIRNAWRALGLARLGEVLEAWACLERARIGSADPELLERMERRLAGLVSNRG